MSIASFSQSVSRPGNEINLDAPYEKIQEAQEWWRSLERSGEFDQETLRMIARGNAIRLLKLYLKE